MRDSHKIFDRLERLHNLIRHKATGSPAELAKRLGTTERTVYNWISLMKSMGAPIGFCRDRQTYHYEREVELLIGFRELSDSEKRNVEGGTVKIFSTFLQVFSPLKSHFSGIL